MKTILSAMALLAVTQVSTAVSSAPATSSMAVEGSSFVLHLADGREVRSPQMVGAMMVLGVEDMPVAEVRIASVTPDPENPDLLRHEFQIQNAPGAWVPACKPNADGETWGFPIALPEGHPGRVGPITTACVSGALAKCARFGYAPWRSHNGVSLAAHYTACVHMVRADYGGDDRPNTRIGTRIDMWDRVGVHEDDTPAKPGFRFEAGWGPHGAVCVAQTRWKDLVTLEQLRAQYPGRFDHPCDATEAAALGALLFNRSMDNRIAP